jgi:hypothetical protein
MLSTDDFLRARRADAARATVAVGGAIAVDARAPWRTIGEADGGGSVSTDVADNANKRNVLSTVV